MRDLGIYRLAGKLLEDLLAGKGTIQTLALQDKVRHKAQMVALLSQSFKYKEVLMELIKASGLHALTKQKKEGLTEGVLLVLMYDLLIGLHNGSGSSVWNKAQQALLKAYPGLGQYKTRLHAEWTKLKLKRGIREDPSLLLPLHFQLKEKLPKYARVNRVKTDLKRVTASLLQAGFKEQVWSLSSPSPHPGKIFMQDEHIPDLLVFPPKSIHFHDFPLVLSGHLIPQDKASCFPAFILNPSDEAPVVLDGCAAPGNKTSHLAALLSSSLSSGSMAGATLIAVEKDKKRFDLLNKLLTRAGVFDPASPSPCLTVSTLNMDFLSIDPTTSPFSTVTHVLLDPSCSGSGMISRIDSNMEPDPEQDTFTSESGSGSASQQTGSETTDRLKKLAMFQISLLKHAFSFPKVREVVYSTCSIHEVENEWVVAEVLAACPHFDLVQDVLPTWSHRGQVPTTSSSLSPEQAKCLIRADFQQDNCNGFFVAKFCRRRRRDSV